MGLDIQNAKFLSLCKKMGVDYSSTLTFGRQEIVVKERMGLFSVNDNKFVEAIHKIQNDKYADGYLAYLGASKIDVADASEYEGANIIIDLNEVRSNYIEQSFSCVIDLGTLEHVFHYTRALQTAMSCVAEGGHIIIATPANNLMGHGFYQLSPELFLRAFSQENGFTVVKIILADQFDESPWYEVDLDHIPTQLATRFIPPSNFAPTYVMVLAKRDSIKPIFSSAPQQMSYESMWNNKDANFERSESAGTLAERARRSPNRIVRLIKKSFLMKFYRRLRALMQSQKVPDYYRVIPSNEWMNY